jgi:hypothetical protein
MDWILVVFVAFKVLVFGTGMFFAIKWHYEQGKKKKSKEGSGPQAAAGLAPDAPGTRARWSTDLF